MSAKNYKRIYSLGGASVSCVPVMQSLLGLTE